jgi:hypothetical protein
VIRQHADAALRRARPLTCLAVGVALITTGCGSGGADARERPSAEPTAVPSPTATSSEVARVLAQYRSFWSNLNAASRLAEADRVRLLERFASDAALKSLLAGIARERAKGHVFYGAEKPRPQIKTLSVGQQPVAVIDDCQDASATGLEDVRSHRRLTVGVARNHVVATMHQMADGVWRVVFVTYPKTPC